MHTNAIARCRICLRMKFYPLQAGKTTAFGRKVNSATKRSRSLVVTQHLRISGIELSIISYHTADSFVSLALTGASSERHWLRNWQKVPPPYKLRVVASWVERCSKTLIEIHVINACFLIILIFLELTSRVRSRSG